MSSSDSEEFESADEDFEETKKDKSKETTKAHENRNRTDEDKSNLVSNKESKINKDDFPESHMEKEPIKLDRKKSPETQNANEFVGEVDVVSKEEQPKDEKNDKPENEKEETQKDVIEESKENKEECPSKLDDKDIKNDQDKNKEVEKKGSVNDEEGWDVDDWGEEGTSSNDQLLKINKIEQKPIVNELENEGSNEDDGWEFDDWGNDDDNDTQNAATLKDNTKMFFPVLDNMSPTRTTKPSVGLMENISKLMPTGTTYDNFTVLNQLTSTKQKIQELHAPSSSSSSTNSENMSSDDKSRPSVSSNWAWKPWGGVVSLLSTASDGVATLTSHVSSVIESGIGVPEPAEMARLQREQYLKQMQNSVDDPVSSSAASCKEEKSEILGNFMYGVTNISNRVISGGLDTLEGIGKKTMTILQENDPGLLKKRKLLGLDNNGPVLSQVLREAKEKTEQAERNLKIVQKHEYKKQLHFESLFDEYHGLVHLEALEMLSKQSSLKLESLLAPLSGIALDDIQDTMNEVKELCELPDLDNEDSSDGMYSEIELGEKLKRAVEDLDIPVNFDEILRCWRESTEWLGNSSDKPTAQQIHDKALRCLAHTSALAVNKMHKLGELLLIKERHSTANEADALVQMTTVICWHLSSIGTRFCNALSNIDSKTDTNSFITSIFLEGSNSISYIQNAFNLFLPILQIGAA